MNTSPISRTGALSRSGVPACTNTPAHSDIPSRTGAAYIRVSTDDQTELSPDAQLRMIRAAALADIHARERQVERMDYLRHQLRKRQETRRK